MEAAAWLAGEPWSDEPASVHPVIAAIARWVNDSVDDRRRQELWPMVMASLGTARHRSPVLHWRLRAAAGRAKRTAMIAHDPPLAWTETLERYRHLTSRREDPAPGQVPDAAPATGAAEPPVSAPQVTTGRS